MPQRQQAAAPGSPLACIQQQRRIVSAKRPEWKDIQPGKWDTSVGGHVDLGESVEMALKREAGEELGISDFTPQLLTHYVFESDREKELVFSHKTVFDGPISPSEELAGGRFWPLDEIRQNLGKTFSRLILSENSLQF